MRNKILVVENNALQLKLLTTILEKEGYHVYPKTSGLEALQALSSMDPDLILLDIQMPEIDGIETCRRIRLNPENLGIPILFITAYTELELMIEAFRAGGIDYISKPFNRHEVIARVRAQLRYRELIDEREQLIKALDRSANERMLGQLSMGLAHNFNNLLTGALGFCQLTEMSTKEEQTRSHVKVVRDELKKMHQMIADLVEFSDRSEKQIYHTNLLATIRENVQGLTGTFLPKVEYEVFCELPESELLMDLDVKSFTTCLFQILKNSEENAKDEKAFVRIELSKSVLPESVRKRNSGDNLFGEFLCLRFADCGKGLGGLEHPEEIFQPFWTTKKTVGVGLGLSVVHGFMARLNGYVNAYPSEVGGAVIELYFPR